MKLFLYLSLFLNILIFLIFYKYSIDKNSIINELIIKKDKYKKSAWKLRTEKNPLQDSFESVSRTLINLRNGQLALVKDIQDTNIEDNPKEFKEDLINAILNLEFYLENNKNEN